jgi:hypothetical protein
MTTTYIDRHGAKHYGVMARVVAGREGGAVVISRRRRAPARRRRA